MVKTAKTDVALWVKASRYDLTTARALLQSRRHTYVLFMCQQCLEKLLKACVMERTGELARRYPPEIEALAKAVKRAMAADYLRQTEAQWKRLKRRLTRTR